VIAFKKGTLANYRGIVNSHREEAIEPVAVGPFKGAED